MLLKSSFLPTKLNNKLVIKSSCVYMKLLITECKIFMKIVLSKKGNDKYRKYNQVDKSNNYIL